jgi:branched-chain amino acid transport system permease protein
VTDAPQRAALVPLPLVLTALVIATAPIWIGKIGLYPYLALEITIWIIYALGYNLLLGYGGLPSFGHGAFSASGPMRSGSRK